MISRSCITAVLHKPRTKLFAITMMTLTQLLVLWNNRPTLIVSFYFTFYCILILNISTISAMYFVILFFLFAWYYAYVL